MSDALPMSPAEFEQALRAKGAYYHIHHPYHVAMYQGRATREQIQGWVANRFYYQVNIPMKDAAILANCPDREIRREWIQRLLDHDGAPGEDGGIEAWLRLGQAVGSMALPTTLFYNAEGRLLAHADALDRCTTWRYNEAGLIAQRVDAAEQAVTYRWDKLGQLVALENENGRLAHFHYDVVVCARRWQFIPWAGYCLQRAWWSYPRVSQCVT